MSNLTKEITRAHELEEKLSRIDKNLENLISQLSSSRSMKMSASDGSTHTTLANKIEHTGLLHDLSKANYKNISTANVIYNKIDELKSMIIQQDDGFEVASGFDLVDTKLPGD